MLSQLEPDNGVTSHTIFRFQATLILHVKVRECSMNMGTNFLSSFCRAKNSYDWNFWAFLGLRRTNIIAKLGIVVGRSRLVVVYAV